MDTPITLEDINRYAQNYALNYQMGVALYGDNFSETDEERYSS